MITATVKIKKVGYVHITDAIGFSVTGIQESFEEMYGDDEEVIVIDVMVQ